MRVMTRVQAQFEEILRYYDGRTCRRGHASERYTKSGACVQCSIEFRNSERGREINRVSSQEHRDNNREGYRMYIREYMRFYRETETGYDNCKQATKKHADKVRENK